MTYEEWFEQHRDILSGLLRNDQVEALWLAWYAGYKKGLDDRIEIDKELWSLK